MRAPEIELLTQTLKGPGSIEEKVQFLASARKRTETSARIDEYLIAEVMRVDRDLTTIQREQERLRKLLAQMTRPPLCLATFLRPLSEGLMVALPGGMRRIVNCSEEFDASFLNPGDEVLLNSDLTFVVAAAEPRPYGGEVGTFDRMLDGRVILRHRDEEYVAEPVGSLHAALESLTVGDLVRFDRNAMLAYERLPRSGNEHFFETAPPKATFADIGGLEKQIEEIKSLITLRYFHPEKALGYGLNAAGGILLEGPAGTGKTMLAGALAHWVGEISGEGARWIAIQPGELRSEYYGVTERKFRECFAAARAAGARDGRYPVILFFDELDAISATRGQFASHIDDRVMQAFAAELDGVNGKGNILCIGATNRADALDPAIQRRFADKRIQVPRPDMRGAAAILGKHIASGCPVYCNGHGSPEAARADVIDAAISRLYAPNGEAVVGKLVFRDAAVREIKPAELVSGANLANIARIARERACWREVEGGHPGVRAEDLFSAIEQELENLARVLTPANARHHLVGLPEDMDVVRIERPPARRRRSTHTYLVSV